MGKKKNKRVSKAQDQPPASTSSNIDVASSSTPVTVATTSSVAADPILGYRVRVLLHDFLNLTKDPGAERRINATTDEHYISTPYFDELQAAAVKAAIVDVELAQYDPTANMDENLGQEDTEGGQGSDPDVASQKGRSFDAAARALLNSFIEKRRASGDARPCGPHHLAPLYASLFGIDMEELKDSSSWDG